MTKEHYSKEILKKGGIYQITNTINGKVYIGSSIYLKNRFSTHKSYFEHRNHPNNHLRNAIKFYGSDVFEFEILKLVEWDEKHSKEDFLNVLLKYEQFYINLFDSHVNGYNQNPTAGSSIGFKCSEDVREKISKVKTEKFGIKCILYDLDGNFHCIVNSLKEASKIIGCHVSAVNKSLKISGKCKKFIVKHFTDNFPLNIKSYKKIHPGGRKMPILIINEDREVIAEFISIRESLRHGWQIGIALREHRFVNNKKYGYITCIRKDQFQNDVQF